MCLPVCPDPSGKDVLKGGLEIMPRACDTGAPADSDRISIDDKAGPTQSIAEDAVSCFIANPVDREERCPKIPGRLLVHSLYSSVGIHDMVGQMQKPAGLHPVKPGAPDEVFDLSGGGIVDCPDTAQSCLFQGLDRPLYVLPTGLLGQDRPNHDLLCVSAPPVDLTVMPREAGDDPSALI